MIVSYTFLNKLDLLYNNWKAMYFLNYSKTLKDKNRKMIKLTIKKILRLLIN